MKATQLRSRLKEKVAPKVGKVLRTPKIPDRILETRLVQGMAARTTKALEKLVEVRDRAEALKLARQSLRQKHASASVRERFDDVRRELSKVLEPVEKRADASEGVPVQKRKTSKPMPEMIKTKSGGKRLPAAVAKRAVKKGASDFKVKKGQK